MLGGLVVFWGNVFLEVFIVFLINLFESIIFFLGSLKLKFWWVKVGVIGS